MCNYDSCKCVLMCLLTGFDLTAGSRVLGMCTGGEASWADVRVAPLDSVLSASAHQLV